MPSPTPEAGLRSKLTVLTIHVLPLTGPCLSVGQFLHRGPATSFTLTFLTGGGHLPTVTTNYPLFPKEPCIFSPPPSPTSSGFWQSKSNGKGNQAQPTVVVEWPRLGRCPTLPSLSSSKAGQGMGDHLCTLRHSMKLLLPCALARCFIYYS